MPERVTFAPKSAERIAKVVKRVENTPVAEPIQQRRRAGGYRMESLFEVTEVQAGEETVTLKRVQDTDDNLNDRSETIDVAYDPDNTPTVGDRGLIIRLGDGTRFFFRRGIVRIPVTEVARVNDSTPDTNDGFWVTGEIPAQLEETESHEERYAFKFRNQLPASVPLSGLIQLGASGAVRLTSITSPEFQDQVIIGVSIKPIRDDFTPSTLTWNQLVALTKGTAQGLLGANTQDFKHPTIPAGGDLLVGQSSLTGSSVQGTPNNWDSAYGFEVLFSHAIPGTFTAWSLTTGPWVILNTRTFIEWI